MSTFIEKARRTLLEVAHERPRSVADYSDSRLTDILNAHSAAEIVREVLNNRQALGDIATRSYSHSNGFDKITLISNGKPEFKLRLHIRWPPGRSGQNIELIHNHRWLFRSTTLCGSAQVETFTEKDGGEPMCRHEYFPRHDALEKYDLKFVGPNGQTDARQHILDGPGPLSRCAVGCRLGIDDDVRQVGIGTIDRLRILPISYRGRTDSVGSLV
jgi:hypothetical protein